MKDQALRKARALELARKQQARAIKRQIINHPLQQIAYQSFVNKHYMQEKTGKESFLEETEARYLAKQNQEPLGQIIEVLSKRLATNAKSLRHQEAGNALSAQEWLDMPKMLQSKKVSVYYDMIYCTATYCMSTQQSMVD